MAGAVAYVGDQLAVRGLGPGLSGSGDRRSGPLINVWPSRSGAAPIVCVAHGQVPGVGTVDPQAIRIAAGFADDGLCFCP